MGWLTFLGGLLGCWVLGVCGEGEDEGDGVLRQGGRGDKGIVELGFIGGEKGNE